MSKPSREWVGLSAPPPATRPLTGAEVVGVQQPDPENPGEYNSRPTTLAAIMEDIGGGGSASAITSPDASARQEALDDGQVLTTIGGEVIEEVRADAWTRSVAFDADGAAVVVEQSVSAEHAGGRTVVAFTVPEMGTVRVTSQTGTNGDEVGTLQRAEMLVDDVVTSFARVAIDFLGKVEIDGSESATITAPAVRLPSQLAADALTPAEQTSDGALPLVLDSNGNVVRGERFGAADIGALPKPGGTTTANGIVTGSGTSGAAVAVSTTVIADLVKRLGNVFTLSANTVLDDSYSGSVIFTDTSGGARQHTVPTTVSAGWNAVFVREGANTLKVIGDGTMLMKGPAAAANEVSIAVDDGGVSVIRRSATKCWCAGKIS